MEKEDVKFAVNSMFNDVIEQAFQYLVQHPQQSDGINRIIKEASDEMNYQMLKIDAHNHPPLSPDLQGHFNHINKDVHRKSLELLSKLQSFQREEKEKNGQVRSD